MADYAGVGSRIVALIVDSIILMVITFVLALPIGATAGLTAGLGGVADMAQWASFSSFIVIAIIVNFGYFIYFEGTTGQTLGKKAVNIKVVKEAGGEMDYMTAIIRTVCRIIDSFAFYLLGFILILATEKKQRIGDLAAGTLVVKG